MPDHQPAPDEHSLGIVGQPTPRIDGWDKVTGAHRFLSDLDLGDTLWASVIRSPHPRARLISLDTAAVQALPDVAGIFQAADLPQVRHNTALAPDSEILRASGDHLLLTDIARHAGDGVAVVVAATQAGARVAAAAAAPVWQPLTPVLDLASALERDRVIGDLAFGDDDTAQVLADAFVSVSRRFEIAGAQHVCLETHQCAALPSRGGGLTLWSNTQSPAALRDLVARVTGIGVSRLRVRKISEGGGFGCRQEMFEEALVCWLANRLGRGVRLAYSRAEEFAATRRRHGARIDVTVGADADGLLLAADMLAVIDSGAYASHTPYVVSAMAAAVKSSYPHLRSYFRGKIVRTDTLPAGAYRGYGLGQANFAIESTIDSVADRLGIDPAEVRHRNSQAHPRLRSCLAEGGRKFSWPRPSEAGGLVARASGMAVAVKGTTFGDDTDVSQASVTLQDNRAVLCTGTCDSGTGSSTVLAQVVAEELGLSPGQVTVIEGDTAAGPVDVGSAAQRSVVLGAGAARLAAREARSGNPGPVTFQAERAPASYAACYVSVAVDTELGTVRVDDCLIVVDAGRILNPAGALGQVQGGVIQGLGLALIDRWEPGETGQGPATIQDHGVPTAADTPDVTVVFTGNPAPGTPYGALGLGELPIVPVAAAVANAISRATGAEISRSPMRPEEVWRAIQAARADHSRPAPTVAGAR